MEIAYKNIHINYESMQENSCSHLHTIFFLLLFFKWKKREMYVVGVYLSNFLPLSWICLRVFSFEQQFMTYAKEVSELCSGCY